jgi:putative flippase GtrA
MWLPDRAPLLLAPGEPRPRSLPAQFLRYLACAGFAAVVNFVVGSLLVDGFGFASARLFPLAVAIAYGLGMAVNLLLNRRFTFASDRTRGEQARTFIVVALSGLVLTTALAALARAGLVWALGAAFFPAPLGRLAAPETLSRALAIGVVSVYSFAAHKYFTFHRGIRWPLSQLVHSLRFGGSVGYD